MAVKVIHNTLDSFVSSIEPFKDTCEVRVGYEVKVSTSENLNILFFSTVAKITAYDFEGNILHEHNIYLGEYHEYDKKAKLEVEKAYEEIVEKLTEKLAQLKISVKRDSFFSL